MTPTREDLIQLLSKQPQAGIDELVGAFGATASDLLRLLKRGDDFEPCAPRPQDKPGFAYRLSMLAVDPRVRAAAIKHHREVEQPPQVRRRDYTSVRPTGTAASVLLDWLRQNPGEWTLAQIAEARGVGVMTIRCHIKAQRTALLIRRQDVGTHGGRRLLVSLKPHHAA